jgi:hypothetical protein
MSKKIARRIVFWPDSVDLLIRRFKRLQINLARKLCGASMILSCAATKWLTPQIQFLQN